MINLPVIKKGLEVGIISLVEDQIEVINDISFSCKSIIDCCSKLRIPVTEHDIQRIMDNGIEMDQIIENYSPVILPSKTTSGSTEKVYIIKQRPFIRGCTFLNEKNLCSIHEFKPFACRIYPFALEVLNENKIRVVIHTDSLCNAILYSSNNNSSEILSNIRSFVLNEMKEREGFN